MKRYFTIPILALAVWGCAEATRVYIHPQADLYRIKKVVVLPFANLTGQNFAGEKVTEYFITECLINKRFTVAEPGEVSRAAREGGLALGQPSAQGMDVQAAQKLGAALKAQAVFLGTVQQYEMASVAGEQYPVVSVSARLLDVETATIIWMGSTTLSGGPTVPVFGFGEIRALAQLTQVACKKLVTSLNRGY